MKFVLMMLIFFCFISCGKKKSDSPKTNQFEDAEGLYYGPIYSLNSHYSGNPYGYVKITKYGDEFLVKVKLASADIVTHMQFLHSGSNCPGIDFNGDGVIDAEEVKKESQPTLLSLQWGGVFPYGNYTYEESSSYSLLMTDWKIKKLDITNRVFVVYGISNHKHLPSTVAAMPGKTQHESLPIGCASLYPEVYEPEEVPLPPVIIRPEEDPPLPPLPPEPEPRTSWLQRLSARLQHWWCRMRRRCS